MSYTTAEAKDRFAAIKQDLKEGNVTAEEAAVQRAYVEQRLNGTADANLPQWSDPHAEPAVPQKPPKRQKPKTKGTKRTKTTKKKAKKK